MMGSVDADPPTPHSCASSNPTTDGDTRRYVSICGAIPGPQGVSKGSTAQGQLVPDHMFIDDLTKDIEQNIHQVCARNTNPRAKPKSSDSKSDSL